MCILRHTKIFSDTPPPLGKKLYDVIYRFDKIWDPVFNVHGTMKGCTLDESLVDALDTMKDCALDERSENKLGLLRGEVTDCTLDERSEIVWEKQWERKWAWLDFVKALMLGTSSAELWDWL